MLRRRVLIASAVAILPAVTPLCGMPAGQRLGIVSSSYWKRWKGRYSNLRFPPFQDALELIDHTRGLGVGSVQVGVEGWTAQFAQRVRASGESYGLNVEGSIQMPRAAGDAERFEQELRIGRDAGATVFRTALGGRRYEVFTSRADFEQWRTAAIRSLEWAEPIARRLKVRIAVENHKDFEWTELVEALRKISSSHIGACIDTGNSLALLEDPMQVVSALAPFAVTVHLKDMAMREYADGFQLAEVPLGQGILPLQAMLTEIRKANPEARVHLEMITRDPLDIPCLRDEYWATFPNKPGFDLARTLAGVRSRPSQKMNRVSDLPLEALLALEEANISQSLAYAGQKLGFDQIQLHKAVTPHQDP